MSSPSHFLHILQIDYILIYKPLFSLLQFLNKKKNICQTKNTHGDSVFLNTSDKLMPVLGVTLRFVLIFNSCFVSFS